MKKDRIGLRLRQQIAVDLVAGEDSAPGLGFVFLAHAGPDVGINHVRPVDGRLGIVFDNQLDGRKPGREPRLEGGREFVPWRRGQHEVDAEEGRCGRQ